MIVLIHLGVLCTRGKFDLWTWHLYAGVDLPARQDHGIGIDVGTHSNLNPGSKVLERIEVRPKHYQNLFITATRNTCNKHLAAEPLVQ